MFEPQPEMREIQIGGQVVTGAVCLICPGRPVIFPVSAMEKHVSRHALPILQRDGAAGRWRRGRPPGSKNRTKMSVVEMRKGIRKPR